jgi:hypothetical protein
VNTNVLLQQVLNGSITIAEALRLLAPFGNRECKYFLARLRNEASTATVVSGYVMVREQMTRVLFELEAYQSHDASTIPHVASTEVDPDETVELSE